MPEPKSDTKLCSKCVEPLDTEGYPLWCKACRTKYQKEANAIRAQMERNTSFYQGSNAMRETLAKEFERLGTGNFSGFDCAQLIRNARGPLMEA